jgi:SAM-dependent methyltransferase
VTWEDAVRWFMAQPEHADLAKAAYFGDPLQAAKRYQASAEFAEILKLIPKQTGRALDLGAGNGILSYALAKEGWQVTAVEPDPSSLVGAGAIRALGTEHGIKIDVIEAFGEAIPLEAAGFDLVVARQVLHHAHDLPSFCHEMARLVRSGGTIITLRDHVISNQGQLQAFLDGHPLHHLYGGENAFTLEAYRNALRGAGFAHIEEFHSFASVLNYDPKTQGDIRQKLAEKFGYLKSLGSIALELIPFHIIANIAAKLDRRPGRLVSFMCRKP